MKCVTNKLFFFILSYIYIYNHIDIMTKSLKKNLLNRICQHIMIFSSGYLVISTSRATKEPIQHPKKASASTDLLVNSNTKSSKSSYTVLRSTIHIYQGRNAETMNHLPKQQIIQHQSYYKRMVPSTKNKERWRNNVQTSYGTLQHTYILKQAPPTICTACKELYTIKHTLTNSCDFTQINLKYYQTSNMNELTWHKSI